MPHGVIVSQSGALSCSLLFFLEDTWDLSNLRDLHAVDTELHSPVTGSEPLIVWLGYVFVSFLCLMRGTRILAASVPFTEVRRKQYMALSNVIIQNAHNFLQKRDCCSDR